MPARDTFHNAVRVALIKDGWTITHDPYHLVVGGRNTFIDLAAEQPIAAEKAGRKIAVEIKSFVGQSELAHLEQALGQYSLYRIALRSRDPERTLFLAVPVSIRDMLMEERDFKEILRELKIHIFFYDPDGEAITEWIEIPSMAP